MSTAQPDGVGKHCPDVSIVYGFGVSETGPEQGVPPGRMVVMGDRILSDMGSLGL